MPLSRGMTIEKAKYLGGSLKPPKTLLLVNHCSQGSRAGPAVQDSLDLGTLTLPAPRFAHGPPSLALDKDSAQMLPCK